MKLNCRSGKAPILVLCGSIFWLVIGTAAQANDAGSQRWKYSPTALKPFWLADVVDSEPVLFVRDPESGEARASLLFPVQKVLAVRSSAGDITYTEGVDFRYTTGSREIMVPPGSRIITKTPGELRRPADSQKHKLTHRDGGGEIFFGARLEYHQMQTCVTYRRATNDWPVAMTQFNELSLPRTVNRLRDRQPVSVVLLGDSISTGCNASAWGEGAPFQPAYPELLQKHLEAQYDADVVLTNLSVGGKSTPWGLTMIDQVVEHQPDLVIIAFGMNDSAGLSPQEYGANTAAMIAKTRESIPDAEFALVASMLGNRDWTRLNHEVFPKYRDELAKLCDGGVGLADMTSVWSEFLKRKKDADLTGNGVNHPNDFGHRVYAQVLSALLTGDDR